MRVKEKLMAAEVSNKRSAKMSEIIECPYCKSVRYNTSGLLVNNKEEHLFCRGCDKEFIVRKEDNGTIKVEAVKIESGM